MESFIGIKVNKIINMLTVNKNSNSINDTLKIEYNKVPSLPKHFFEKVIECEVKLKEKFNIRVFQKLANLYSNAISYYESIDDPKFMVYNQSLGMLFSHPEAKKYLVGGAMKEKLKKDKIKKKIQNCEKKVTSDKVKKFIKRKGAIDSKKVVINNLINKDIDIQQNDFRKRLEEKKKKFQLSISDNIIINNNIGKAFQNIGINSIETCKNNESIDFISEKELKFNEKDISNINSITNNSFTDKKSK